MIIGYIILSDIDRRALNQIKLKFYHSRFIDIGIYQMEITSCRDAFGHLHPLDTPDNLDFIELCVLLSVRESV